MIPLPASFALIIVVVALCFTQRTLHRQHAAYVYGVGCASHFLMFEYMKLDGIAYPWVLDYFVAAIISSAVITALQNLPAYTKFHQRLQWISLASIAINGVGVLVQYLNLDILIYQVLALSLLLILLRELWRDGGHFEVSRNSGFFSGLRWPAI